VFIFYTAEYVPQFFFNQTFIFLDNVDTPLQTTTLGSAFMPWGLHREPPVAHQNARRQLATRLTYHVPEPTTTLFHHFR